MSFILNSGFCVFLIFAFKYIAKKIPVFDKISFTSIVIFILLSVLLGRGLNFYTLVPHWDKILHFLSGFISARAGKVLFTKLEGDTKKKMLWFIFTLSIAFSVAAVWEIWEFFCDAVFSTTSQNGSLQDTMADIIFAVIAAILYTLSQFRFKSLFKTFKKLH